MITVYLSIGCLTDIHALLVVLNYIIETYKKQKRIYNKTYIDKIKNNNG